ncbi:MAG: class B sortase [Lachnospiraceae bacterium]|nr:class B sortase [Lachnospiraceae bacterium]
MPSDKKKKIICVIQKGLTCLMIISVCYLLWYQQDSRQSKEKYERLVSMTDIEDVNGSDQEETSGHILENYQSLYQVNQDMVGWIEIEDTDLSYPVVQTKNNSYYLDHDFDKAQDRHGCIFADQKCDVDSGNHIMLYGHHMKDGSMFASLEDYKEKDYYEQHRRIKFDTLYETRTYEVVAVFQTKAYAYPNIDSEKAFQAYYDRIREAALYPAQLSVEYGDQLLTLVTCSYQMEEGRFIIVAKRVE